VLPHAGAIDGSGRKPQNSPYQKDPYANIAIKPNSIDYSQLQKQAPAGTPAGMISELRKSSPTGHNNNNT